MATKTTKPAAARKPAAPKAAPKATKPAAAAKPAAPKVRKDSTGKPNARACGFPDVYVADNGRFRQGLDARAKADLRAALTGKPTGRELHTFGKAEARRLANTRGWDL